MYDVYKEAIKRRNDEANISLEDVIKRLEFTSEDIRDIERMIEEDDE